MGFAGDRKAGSVVDLDWAEQWIDRWDARLRAMYAELATLRSWPTRPPSGRGEG
jgi:hypothetical protein